MRVGALQLKGSGLWVHGLSLDHSEHNLPCVGIRFHQSVSRSGLGEREYLVDNRTELLTFELWERVLLQRAAELTLVLERPAPQRPQPEG
jgi:hypothetical protein